MNAVKSCLVVLAAVALASCNADPTKDLQGADLAIVATPGQVAIHANETAQVLVEAKDPLGGATDGRFTVAAHSGAFSVAVDSTYKPVYAGTPITNTTKFVITPDTTAQGVGIASDGWFVVSGTGGRDSIPVRILPDTNGFLPTISNTTLANVDSLTVTAPAGMQFSANSKVWVYHGGLSADSGQFSPYNVTVSPSLDQVKFTVGPNNSGQIRITGIAATSAPTLAIAARTFATITTPTLDTTGVDSTTPGISHITVDKTAPAFGDTVTATLPAGWKFTPSSTVDYYSGPTAAQKSSGLASPIVVGISADSQQMQLMPGPAAKGHVRITNVVVTNNHSLVYGAVRGIDSANVPTLTLTPTFSSTAPALNAPVTVTLPGTFKLRGTSAATFFDAQVNGPTNPIVTTRAADSSSISLIPMPRTKPTDTATAVTLTKLLYVPVPAFQLTMTSTDSIKRPLLADLGTDGGADPTADATIYTGTAPTVSGTSTGWFDKATFEAPDNIGGGGANQYYKLVVPSGVNVTISVDWTSGTDLDMYLIDATFSNFVGGFGAASSNKPEKMTTALAAGTYYICLVDYGGDAAGKATLRLEVHAN